MGKARRRRAAVVAKARNKRREVRIRETQRQQAQAATRQLSPRAYRARRTLGWTLVGLGIVVGVSHWLTHIGVWDFASQGIEDLVAGYPMAALLAIGGAIVLSR
jgi:hypothetical protein